MDEQGLLKFQDQKSIDALISPEDVRSFDLVALGDWNSGAVFSSDRKYRYRLWRNWSDAEGRKRRVATWIMLNPSTATELVLDPTIKRCVSFSKKWGYGGIEIVNVFAYRSTDPSALKDVKDPVGFPYNDTAILQTSRRSDIGLVMAAWGVHAKHLGRVKTVAPMLRAESVLVYHLGPANKDGSPRHPLYVHGATQPVLYNTEH